MMYSMERTALATKREDGKSLLRRFTTEAIGSTRPWRGELGGTGASIRGERSVGMEDFIAAAANGADGASSATAWAAQWGDDGSRGAVAESGAGTNRPNAGGVAARVVGKQRGALQHAASVACAPANEIAVQKKSLHAQEQDTPEARQRRQAWQETVSRLDPARLVFLDESGVSTEMTRRYGRAPRGERVREATPAGHWSTLTLLGAMTAEGLLATMTIDSPTDGDVFLAYVEQVLCPRLQPGQIVILDNLGAHKVAGVRELVQAAGAELLYLPPYSPDFNPIEHCWGKVKQKLRSLKARTLDSLQQAVSEALSSITPGNASAWFAHCGYAIQQ
jgi:transposase